MPTTDVPFRMTPQRQAVLDVVRASAAHPSAEEIHREVQARAPGLGVATVYRTLDLLVEHRLVRELRLGEHPVARYDGNVERHDHVRCSDCGRVWDVDLDLPPEVLASAGDATGVEVQAYDLQLTGRCPDCR